jgi:hypothetical protein
MPANRQDFLLLSNLHPQLHDIILLDYEHRLSIASLEPYGFLYGD